MFIPRAASQANPHLLGRYSRGPIASQNYGPKNRGGFLYLQHWQCEIGQTGVRIAKMEENPPFPMSVAVSESNFFSANPR